MMSFDAGSSDRLPLRYHFRFRVAMVLALPFPSTRASATTLTPSAVRLPQSCPKVTRRLTRGLRPPSNERQSDVRFSGARTRL
jgi:hypothetical protein